MDIMQAIIANVYRYFVMGEFKGRLVHLYTLGLPQTHNTRLIEYFHTNVEARFVMSM